MRVFQTIRTSGGDWVGSGEPLDGPADLALVFAAPALLRDAAVAAEVGARCQGAVVLGASTAGEIHGARVHDDVVSLTLVRFASTRVALAALPAAAATDSRLEGHRLASMLPPGADHVFVLFQGHDVNGSELVAGLRELIPDGTGITGGLAADGARFGETAVVAGNALGPVRGAAVGFYGGALQVGAASMGGWDAFGPVRRITRSSGNVLHELDGIPALGLYRKYLGDHAKALPGSALLFPLAIWRGPDDPPVVRTILGCDEATESMTFAGDVPEGAMAQLMHANLDRLVSGAECAAEAAIAGERAGPQLAVLISCVGRRLVLKDYVEDEVLAVRNVFGPGAALTGFYSYGEISPFTPSARCELHNQTMTITSFAER